VENDMKSTPCSGATQGGSHKMKAAEALQSTDDTVSVPRLKTSVSLAGVAPIMPEHRAVDKQKKE
jgi:hypothetical protein